MTTTVNVQAAKTHLSRLLALVEDGEEVVIARGGTPIAKLVPIADIELPQRKLGFLDIDIPDNFDDPLPPEELARWY